MYKVEGDKIIPMFQVKKNPNVAKILQNIPTDYGSSDSNTRRFDGPII